MRTLAAALMLALAPAAHAAADKAADPRAPIVAALNAGATPYAQANNLAALAWPAKGPRDPKTSELARKELENFSGHSMVTLRDSINTVRPEYTEEVVRTAVQARRFSDVGRGREYLPVLIDALWVGTRPAKEVAIRSMLGDRPGLAVQAMIDSALDDPALEPLVVESLGTLRFEQARFYLEKVMIEGPPSLRPVAASSLAQIGGAALKPLKSALKAPAKEARVLAARALLPAATEFELGALYEYIEKHGDDDPALTQAIKASAVNIEKAIAARDASEAASSPKDF